MICNLRPFLPQKFSSNTFNPSCSRQLVNLRAPVPGASGKRASGAPPMVITCRPLRRFSSAPSPPPGKGELAEPFPNDGDRAEYLGYTLGLRQGSYLALAPGGGANAAAATLIPRGSCDGLFLLAYRYAPVSGHPEPELQDRFFLGLIHGRRQAKVFFGSTSPNSYLEAEELATVALLSYRQAFRWSQTLGEPLVSAEDVSPETLGELARRVREEFRGCRGEEAPALTGIEDFLREGLELFALANPYLVALPPSQRYGKVYSLFNKAFALMYRYLESAPPD